MADPWLHCLSDAEEEAEAQEDFFGSDAEFAMDGDGVLTDGEALVEDLHEPASASAETEMLVDAPPVASAGEDAVPGASAGAGVVVVADSPAKKGKKAKKPAAKPKNGLGRTLKRQASTGKPVELKCEPRLCIWGGRLRAPAVVHPLSKRGETLWVPIHERLFWLRRACDPAKGQTHWSAQFQHAMSELRQALRKGVRDAIADPVEKAAAKVRQELGLDDEEDKEEDATRPRKSLGARSLEAVTIELDGQKLNVRVHERPFEVEASAEAVCAIVSFCRKRLEDDPLLLKRDIRAAAAAASLASAVADGTAESSASALTDGMAGDGVVVSTAAASSTSASASSTSASAFRLAVDACPNVLHKVTWHPSVKAWAAHYKDGAGKTQTRRFYVKLGKRTFAEHAAGTGAADCASWAEARQTAYRKAITFWNSNDRSKRERIAEVVA